MATRRFQIDANSDRQRFLPPRIVTFTWQLFFQNMRLYFGAREIGRIDSAEALRRGQEFQLDDGTLLKLKLESWPCSGLNLYVNGRLCQGSADHSATQSRLLFGIFFVIGLVHLALTAVHFRVATLILGLFFVSMSYAIRSRFVPATLLAIFAFAIETQPIPVLVKILLILMMVRGAYCVMQSRRLEIPS